MGVWLFFTKSNFIKVDMTQLQVQVAASKILFIYSKFHGRHKLVRVQFPCVLQGSWESKSEKQSKATTVYRTEFTTDSSLNPGLFSPAAKRGGSKIDSENEGVEGGWYYAKKGQKSKLRSVVGRLLVHAVIKRLPTVFWTLSCNCFEINILA